MMYPVNEEAFVKMYLKIAKSEEESDGELARAIARALNNAYDKGLSDGKK